MSAHNVPVWLHHAEALTPDPGASGTITVDKSPSICPLVSAGAETRTLARPTRIGVQLMLHFVTDGGNITLTVTGGFNEDGDTTFTFSDPGQWAFFISCQSAAGTFFWQKISDYGIGNIAPGDSVNLALLSGLTATVAELNQAADESANTEVVTTTNIIGADESGKTFFLNQVNGFTSTLPAPALGLRFRFIIKTAPTTAYIITTTGGADILYGMMLERAGTAGVAGAARDTFNFVASQAIIGDWVEFYSDGVNYYYHGMVDVAAGNTVAAT